jgi:Ca2+-binding RTX toxin-like protein
VNLSAAGTFSAAGWALTQWSASDRIIFGGTSGADTITGTAFNDTFLGGAGTDNLSGGGGDDTFVFNTGDLGSGEIINGGAQNSADRIQLASGGTYNFFAATVTGIELLQFLSTGVTTFLSASQLGAGAINAISGNTGFTQSIMVGGSFADLSGVTFTGWGGANQTISITGTSAAANTLTGSSQRDTIRGSGASVDTMTGGGGADSLLGGVGADTFRYLAVTDMVAGETVDGGVGSDTLELLYNGEIDFRSATLASIERLEFGGTQGTQTATFRDDQFGGSGITPALAVEGSSAVNQIVVTADGFFSAGPWTFANWDASQDLITSLGGAGTDDIVGTSQADVMEGGGRGDHLRGVGGDDTFVMRAGDVGTGEQIEGGTHVNGDTISLLANANLSLATIVGVERLSIADLVSTTLSGDQIGGIDPDAITQVIGGGTAATQSLTVNATAATGFSVDLSSEALFSGWGGANQTITINGNSQASDINELTGSVHRDTINGSVIASNVITGGRGADTLNGGNGFDTFVFVQPGDVEAGEVINGNGGFNQLRLDAAGTVAFRVVELNGIQRLQFGTGESTALFLDDQLGVGLINQVSGSSGANVDTLVVDGASTDLSEVGFLSWSGSDRISLNGTNAADTISGSSQNDTITGLDGSDTLAGLGGNDVFRYTSPDDVDNDSIDGGEGGNDTILVSSGTFDFTQANLLSIESLEFGNGLATAILTGAQIRFGAIQTVRGGASADDVIVTGADIDLASVAFQNWSADDEILLLGTAGADSLTGSLQNDRIDGGVGAAGDAMSGGDGNDTYIVDTQQDTVIEGQGQGTNDRVQTSATYALAADCEIEVLETTDPSGTGAITLIGNEFDNFIVGNDGVNVIVGGDGRDTLTGRGDIDAFLWSSIDDTGLTIADADIVADYSNAQGDVLHFTNMDADETLADDQNFTFISTAAFTAPGQINWFSNGTDTFIQLNTDADLAADGVIQLNGVPSGDAVLMFL